MQERDEQQRCPLCGKGVFVDVVYEDPEPDETKPKLTGDSYEVLLFSCGHEVRGTSLATADAERLTVETRDSEGATDPDRRASGRARERAKEPANGRKGGRGGAMIRLETPDPDPQPSPSPQPPQPAPAPDPLPTPEPLPTPQPLPGPIPTPEPPTPEPSPRPEPPPDSEPPIRA